MPLPEYERSNLTLNITGAKNRRGVDACEKFLPTVYQIHFELAWQTNHGSDLSVKGPNENFTITSQVCLKKK